MFRDDSFAGSWRELADRLDRDQVLTRWAHDEPDLRDVDSVGDLVRLTRFGADRKRADRVIGALVRLACAAGGGDDDALLLALHLLSDVVTGLNAQLEGLDYNSMRIVVVELAYQIRAFEPWRHRRGFAATLKWVTRRAVLAELRPAVRNHPGLLAGPIDAGDPAWEGPRIGGAPVPRLDFNDVELADVLAWAVHSGVDRADIELLAATEVARMAKRRRPDEQVAIEFGVSVRTLYRRNKRTLAALQVAGAEYLRAVA